jgi:hypothetical protein
MWTKWWTPASTSKWRMGFNSAFKGLNYLKAKIVRLHSKLVQSITIDTQEAILEGESPSLLRILQIRKRCVSWMITGVIDKDGVTQTTTRGILHTFVKFSAKKI